MRIAASFGIADLRGEHQFKELLEGQREEQEEEDVGDAADELM